MKDGQEWIMRLTLDNETMTVNVERVGEIFRCKDCKYYEDYWEYGICMHHKGLNGKPCADDYCSRAERKEE